MKLFLSLSLVLHLALAGSEGVLLEPRDCSQHCPDDGSDGTCAPNCLDCVCCPHLKVMTVASEARSSSPRQAPCIPDREQVAPPSPEPDDILHIPKPLLA
jgi:hypothetical protein